MLKQTNEETVVEELENDERRGLNQEQKRGNHKIIETLTSNCSEGEKAGESLGINFERKAKDCSKWAYYVLIFLLAGFIIAEFIVQVEISHRNTSKFINNLNHLRASTSQHSRQRNSFQFHLPMLPQTQLQQPQMPSTSFQIQGQQKINLNINQLKQPTPQNQNQNGIASPSALAAQAANEKTLVDFTRMNIETASFIIPQNKYSPYAPSVDQIAKFNQAEAQKNAPPKTIQPSEYSPITNQVLIDIPQNVVIPSIPFSPQAPNGQSQSLLYSNKLYSSRARVVTPNPSFDFQSNGQPQETALKGKVNPIIEAFNIVPGTPNDFGYQGAHASITNTQVSKARERKNLVDKDDFIFDKIATEQKQYYQQKYNIDKYQELPFCIVVPTYNNAAKGRYLKNMKSIIMQDYKNYHIVIIDDASNDNTGGLIQGYLESQKQIQKEKYNIIRNTYQLKAMPNLRSAALNHCKPEEIFLIVDGDDELLGRQVLKLFNSVFQEKKLWFVYSNFLSMTGSVGFSRAFPVQTIERNSYRSYPFVTSHLRAFYTKLFTNIKDEDLKDEQGEYLRAANDVAICIPILEQAHERVGYLPEMTYFYNSNTGLNNHQVRLAEQRNNDRKVRRRATYKRLENLLD